MRHAIVSVLLTGCVTLPVLASQAGSKPAAGQRIRVCSILTREIVMRVSTPDGKALAERARPIDDPVPDIASCQIGRASLMVDPFPRPEATRKSLGKQWQPVPGIGDAAYYMGDKSFGNLYVFASPRNFSIEISVGPSDTPEGVKASAIALAKEVAPKLR